MATVFGKALMVTPTSGSGKTISLTDLESISGVMVMSMKVNGKHV